MADLWDDEDVYWRENYASRPYAGKSSYDTFRPGYRYGYESAQRFRGRQWGDVEKDLERDWDTLFAPRHKHMATDKERGPRRMGPRNGTRLIAPDWAGAAASARPPSGTWTHRTLSSAGGARDLDLVSVLRGGERLAVTDARLEACVGGRCRIRPRGGSAPATASSARPGRSAGWTWLAVSCVDPMVVRHSGSRLGGGGVDLRLNLAEEGRECRSHVRHGGHNSQRDEPGQERVLDEILALLVANERSIKRFIFDPLSFSQLRPHSLMFHTLQDRISGDVTLTGGRNQRSGSEALRGE